MADKPEETIFLEAMLCAIGMTENGRRSVNVEGAIEFGEQMLTRPAPEGVSDELAELQRTDLRESVRLLRSLLGLFHQHATWKAANVAFSAFLAVERGAEDAALITEKTRAAAQHIIDQEGKAGLN